MDDTLDTSKSIEEVLLAMLEANAFEGLRYYDNAADLDDLTDPTPAVIRVERAVAEQGASGGAAFAGFIQGINPIYRGCVMVAFDGWASDPRPLCDIPCVVNFLRGLLLGDRPGRPDHAQARAILRWLIDDDAMVSGDNGKLTLSEAYDFWTGRLWVVANAFSDGIIFSDYSTGRFARDIDRNRVVLQFFMGASDAS